MPLYVKGTYILQFYNKRHLFPTGMHVKNRTVLKIFQPYFRLCTHCDLAKPRTDGYSKNTGILEQSPRMFSYEI